MATVQRVTGENDGSPWVEFRVVCNKGEVKVVTEAKTPDYCPVMLIMGDVWRSLDVATEFSVGERIAEAVATALNEYDGLKDTLMASLEREPRESLPEPPEIAALIDGCANIFGALPADARQRLVALYQHPSEETWEDAYTLILRPGVDGTLWNYVLQADPTFPRTGPTSTATGRQISGWARVPDRQLVLAALRAATAKGDEKHPQTKAHLAALEASGSQKNVGSRVRGEVAWDATVYRVAGTTYWYFRLERYRLGIYDATFDSRAESSGAFTRFDQGAATGYAINTLEEIARGGLDEEAKYFPIDGYTPQPKDES